MFGVMKKYPNWKNDMVEKNEKIVPAILVNDFEELKKQISSLAPIFSLVQIDIMDGEFVSNKSFDEVERMDEIENLPEIELHLMAKHPLKEMEKWEGVKNVKKIIFHIESEDNPEAVIAKINGRCALAGIALNPETPLSAVKPYFQSIHEILFMTVNPGKQGAPFVPEVEEKIKEAAALPEHPLIAVDGAITEKNIAEIKSWGVDVFCVGSALTQATDINAAYQNLSNQIKN